MIHAEEDVHAGSHPRVNCLVKLGKGRSGGVIHSVNTENILHLRCIFFICFHFVAAGFNLVVNLYLTFLSSGGLVNETGLTKLPQSALVA